MKIRQRKAKKPPAPYKLSRSAKKSIVLGVMLNWVSVLGMCFTIVGVGSIIDAYPARPNSVPVFVGPVVVVCALWLRGLLLAKGQVREESLVRHKLVDAVFAAGPARSSTTSTGAVVSLASESSEKMMAFRVGFVAQIIASLTAPLLVIATIAVTVSVKAALIVLAMLPIVPLLVGAFRKVVSTVSSNTQDARKELAASYMESLQSLGTLQLLGAAHKKADELEATGERNRLAVMRLLKSNQLILFGMDATFSLALVAVAATIAIHGVNTGELTSGQGIMLLALSILLLEPMDQVGAFFYVGMSGLGGQRGIFGFLRKRASSGAMTRGKAGASSGAASSPGAMTRGNGAEVEDAVIVEDLHFGYDTPIFNGVNLRVAPGERVAIMGPSGQGKSTLLSLLKGNLMPDSGRIVVAGRTGVDLQGASASVNQTTWLFSGTIADNLRFARPDATEKEMWQALERAHVADDIRVLPDGLETELGEQGLGLSGGQAQRISLARAIISGRPVILLDEPTSHVDLYSEREILSAINDLGREFTLIMVTHRISSLEHMDRVIRVENGTLTDVNRERA